MRVLMPTGGFLEHADGSRTELSAEEAVVLYHANRAMREPKLLGRVGGRNEFERDRQVAILEWLADHERPGRERVLLIGDSIRMRQADTTGYGLHAYRWLVHGFNVSHITHNTENSGFVLEHVDDWLDCRPDVVHLNAGLHDLSTNPRSTHLPPWHHPVDRYVDNLRRILDRLRAAGVRTIVWATSTPVHDGWHNVDVRTGRPRGVFRRQADVERYNAAALDLMEREGVPVNDLHAAVVAAGVERCLVADGVHLSADGAALLGRLVAEAIYVARGRPLPDLAALADAGVGDPS